MYIIVVYWHIISSYWKSQFFTKVQCYLLVVALYLTLATGQNTIGCRALSLLPCLCMLLNLPFLSIAFQNICGEGYTQFSLESAFGIDDTCLFIGKGNGWSGAGRWFGGGIWWSKCTNPLNTDQWQSPFFLSNSGDFVSIMYLLGPYWTYGRQLCKVSPVKNVLYLKEKKA